MSFQRTPAEIGEAPRPALSEYGRWFQHTAYLLEFGAPEAIDRSCPELPAVMLPYVSCLRQAMRNDGSVARFICHSLGLRRTSAQGAAPESAPLVDLVLPLAEGISLSTLPSAFIYTIFPLHRRALDHPTMGTPDLGASSTALRWWVLPTYFRVLGQVMVQDETIEEASGRPLDCALSAALYAVFEEEAGDMPPAVVIRCGLRHMADFYVPTCDCVACHNLFLHFREEVRAAGPGWAALVPSLTLGLRLTAAPTPVSSTPQAAPSLQCHLLFGPSSFSPPMYTPAPVASWVGR